MKTLFAGIFLALSVPAHALNVQWDQGGSASGFVTAASQADVAPVEAFPVNTPAAPGLLIRASAAAPAVNVLTFCVKAYSDRETAVALTKCQEMGRSLTSLRNPALSFSGQSCQANARGVAMGFVSAECGVYDVVLQVILTVSAQN